ncbi:MAG: hypothetical protein HOW73_46175 [Polyangiaceae bacterium]|nr:hypothetical protein [Polyangiaceae bacterium]
MPTLFEYLAYDAIDIAQQQALQSSSERQDSLEARVDALQTDNARLRAALERTYKILNVLGNHLVNRGLVDAGKISEELEAALNTPDAISSRHVHEGRPTSAFRTHGEARPVPQVVDCAGCNSSVPTDSTHITVQGNLCETCFTKAEIDRLSKIESEG